MRPPTLSAGPTFALRVPMATFSPSKRSDPLPGIQASGAIVFASIFMLLGLGVGGLLGLHAYVHRSAPPAKPVAAVSAVAVSRTTPHAAVAAWSDKPAATEALSDNPYP